MEDNLGIQEEEDKTEEQVKKEKEEALWLGTCIKDVMERKTGRHFIWHLIGECKVFQDVFSDNAIVLARHTGLRGAGLMILQLTLSTCPEKYELMFNEHKYKEKDNGS